MTTPPQGLNLTDLSGRLRRRPTSPTPASDVDPPRDVDPPPPAPPLDPPTVPAAGPRPARRRRSAELRAFVVYASPELVDKTRRRAVGGTIAMVFIAAVEAVLFPTPDTTKPDYAALTAMVKARQESRSVTGKIFSTPAGRMPAHRVQLSARLSPADIRMLDQIAGKVRAESRSEVVEVCLAAYLADPS